LLPKSFITNVANTLSLLKGSNYVYCLVEKRNFFGDLLIYKIGKHNILSSFTCHPLKNNINFKEKVFGPLKDEVIEIISE
jgi:hypothetical protein